MKQVSVSLEIYEAPVILVKMTLYNLSEDGSAGDIHIHRTSLDLNLPHDFVDVQMGFVNEHLGRLGAEPVGLSVIQAIKDKFIAEKAARGIVNESVQVVAGGDISG